MIYVFPSDVYGCGSYRMIWPAQALIEAGATDITWTTPAQRWQIGAKILQSTGEVVGAATPPDATTIVIQRPAHAHLVGCIPFWRKEGIRVVVDIDDNLSCIDPNNSAFEGLRPKPGSLQSWNHLARAARMADAVTVTTPGLAAQYRPDAVVIPNYLPDAAFRDDRVDSTEICWPASLPSHPNDAAVLGPTLERVARDTGAVVRMLGDGPLAEPALMRAFGLSCPPRMQPYVPIGEYPAFLATIGVGIAPLADTKFNRSKSWLKPLELMAAGVPWVGSPSEDYRRLHAATGVGVLARRPGDWYRALCRMVSDEVFRKEQSEAGRAAAEAYRIRDHAHLYGEVWRG